MKQVTLYTRAGCHLCDDAKKVIEEARRQVEFTYEEKDIDGDAELRQRYNEQVPVIAIDGRQAFRFRVKLDRLVREIGR
jgi:glutaredoxin